MVEGGGRNGAGGVGICEGGEKYNSTILLATCFSGSMKIIIEHIFVQSFKPAISIANRKLIKPAAEIIFLSINPYLNIILICTFCM